MNRAAAWSVRGIGRETRDAAQEAARRAGVSLGEWLDEVIAEQAAEQGVDASDFDEDQRLDAIGDRLSGLPAREGRSRRDGEDRRPSAPSRPAATNDSWRAEELLDAAIGRFESRAARSDARTARAFDSVASLIERSQDERRDEREALKAVVGRLGSLEEKIAGQQAERDAPASRRANRAQPPVENGARDLDERMNELSQRISAANKARSPVRGQARDIDDAVLQIARRRQELDARAGGLAPEPESLKRGWRNFGVDAPATRPMPPAPPTRDVAEQNVLREAALRESVARESAAQAASAATALQAEIRKLSQRLDEVRREQNDKREAPTASIEALRTELAAMSRSLADLAPRNAVVALEGAIRDLSQRVAASRESGARENLLAPVEGLVAGLREALRAHDPREAVAALQREIGAIGAKVNGIADASVDSRDFERIRLQIEETRSLLGALAQRPMPLERLEKKIGELADRIDHLSTSPAPHHESAEVAASLAEARAQVERSTPPSALTSIEWRLEQIASKMDQALHRPSPAPAFSSDALEDLSRRIDGVRQTIETRYASAVQPLLDTSLLESTMREISAKLDRPAAAIDSNALESMMQDLGARIDRRANPVIDTAPLEQVLRKLGERPAALDTRPLEGLMREISAKLDRPAPAGIDADAFENMIHDLGARIDQRPDPVVDTRPLEQTLRSLHDRLDQSVAADGPGLDTRHLEEMISEISAKLDRPAPPVVDVGVFEGMIRDLGNRIDRRPEPVVDTRPLEQTLRALHDKIDQGVASDGAALERMVAELLAQLDETRRALHAATTPLPNAPIVGDAFVRGLADLRSEQNNSDRRIQSTLGGVHDMLERLVDRIGQIEDDVARFGPTSQRTPGATPPAATYPAAAPTPASAALNSMDATIRDAPVFAPARPSPEQRSDREAEPRAPQFAAASPMRSIDGTEFLIEPGAGAPLRALENDALLAGNPKSAVNAHIAAARRAAQAALAETATQVTKGGATPSSGATEAAGDVEQAKSFFAARRRPILLGVALVALLAIAFVELGVMRPANMQKSEIDPIAAPEVVSAASAKQASAAAPAKIDARAIDMTPVGSIGAATASSPTTKFLTPAPADLVAAIPAAAPQALRAAAAAGDPAAQYELASRLADGRAMTRDPHAALLWLDRAAAQGLAPAQYRLGSFYEKGVGVTRDTVLATAWYKKAAEAGNARAMHNLAVLTAEGAGIKPDYSEAAIWFQKAAQLGVKDSQYNLAILYARGMGLVQDVNQSWLWFSLAAQQGDVDAAKKRDEFAAKMDAKALAADAVALANFHVGTPIPEANDVPVPPGGWDVGKIGTPDAPQATNAAPHVAAPL
jgi:localization factor PodJL